MDYKSNGERVKRTSYKDKSSLIVRERATRKMVKRNQQSCDVDEWTSRMNSIHPKSMEIKGKGMIGIKPTRNLGGQLMVYCVVGINSPD